MGQKILVTGGAGYIGSHVVKQLGEAGYEVVVYDNLSTGSPTAILYGELVIGELQDESHLAQVFAQYPFQAVLHLAASPLISGSGQNLLDDSAHHTRPTLNLLKCCQEFGVKQFIFSSTAAVYGETSHHPVLESSPTQPMNPYGYSKLMSEQMIQDYSRVSDLEYVILRYFNVAGADLSGRIGLSSRQANHLIKRVCDAALGSRPVVQIFGTDFTTPYGTGIRDYIHVEDLATAHLDALRYLNDGNPSQIFNCGYGQGYSVRQVIETAKNIVGIDFPVIESERRAGDPACVVACVDKIRHYLGWKPKHNNLATIVGSAIAWERKLNTLAQLEHSLTASHFKLGELLVQHHFISPTQLEQGLREQSRTGQKLGELLVQKTWLSPHSLELLLREQNWLRQNHLMASS